MGRRANRRRRQEERMGELQHALFATEYMDIRRPLAGAEVLVKSNIQVQVAHRAIDNPDPQAVATTPVNMSWELRMPPDTDVRNDDTIILKIINNRREIIEAYRGVSGVPFAYPAEKIVNVGMTALGKEDIRDLVPPPPLDDSTPDIPVPTSKISVRFVDNNESDIRTPITYQAKIGELVKVEALEIVGWAFSHLWFEGNMYSSDLLEFTPSEEEYTIMFVYDKITVPYYLRMFSTGQYVTTAGQPATGSHWWGRMPFHWEGNIDGLIRIVISIPPLSNTGGITHPTNRVTTQFRKGIAVRLFPDDFFAEVQRVERVGNEFVIDMVETTPTPTEASAIITEAYDWMM